jgi:HK97 family phage major capsid protein
MNNNETLNTTNYEKAFWAAMRNDNSAYNKLTDGRQTSQTFLPPYITSKKYTDAIAEKNIFRKIATSVSAPRTNSDIFTSDCSDFADWVSGNWYNIKEEYAPFKKYRVCCHRLAVITRLEDDFTNDIGFDIEEYLVKHFAKTFGRAEEKAFINGTGEDMPKGILHETEGAETGLTISDTITFDDISKLYFSVKAEYRTDGAWLMNDETAFLLRTLKDSNDNYIWEHSTNTIMGKPVYISEFMPSISSGNKPIAFGDFSYYTIIDRAPLSVRTLDEKYALQQQRGYLAYEMLDGMLIRPEAVKVISVA